MSFAPATLTDLGRCAVDGCARPLRKRQWCDTHYANWRRIGTPVPPPKPSEGGRFWSKVIIPADVDGCWEWSGQHDVGGYSRFYPGRPDSRSGVPAHRYAYEWCRGKIGEGLQPDHLCRNRGCVNPWHIEAVEPWVNVRRSTSFAAREATVTHCPRGHEYNAANTYTVLRPNRRPKRQCRRCKAINQRAYKARRVAP